MKSEIRDDLNPEIRKEIEALGWECTNDDANIGDDRHFEKTTDGKKKLFGSVSIGVMELVNVFVGQEPI